MNSKDPIIQNKKTREMAFAMFDAFMTSKEVSDALDVSIYISMEFRRYWKAERGIEEGSVLDKARSYPVNLADDWDSTINAIRKACGLKGLRDGIEKNKKRTPSDTSSGFELWKRTEV